MSFLFPYAQLEAHEIKFHFGSDTPIEAARPKSQLFSYE
jgi:predicted amidohydrolase YtcJ